MCSLFHRNAQQSLEADSNTVATDENLATTNLQQSASNAVTSDKRNTNFDQMTIEVEGGSHLGEPKIFNLSSSVYEIIKNILKSWFNLKLPQRSRIFTRPDSRVLFKNGSARFQTSPSLLI